jgi:hypothetical protein
MIVHTASCKPGLGPRNPAEAHQGCSTPARQSRTQKRCCGTFRRWSGSRPLWLRGWPPAANLHGTRRVRVCACVCVCVCVCARWVLLSQLLFCCSGTNRCAFIHGAHIATAEGLRAPPLRGRRRACALVRLGRVGAWVGGRVLACARVLASACSRVWVWVGRRTSPKSARSLAEVLARASHLCRRSVSRTTDNRPESDE